jgi:hypothetical protein
MVAGVFQVPVGRTVFALDALLTLVFGYFLFASRSGISQ